MVKWFVLVSNERLFGQMVKWSVGQKILGKRSLDTSKRFSNGQCGYRLGQSSNGSLRFASNAFSSGSASGIDSVVWLSSRR